MKKSATYNLTMSLRVSIVILIQFCFAFNNLNAQCCYTKNKKVINDSCKTYTIKTDFEKGLENLPKMGNLNQLIIENGSIPIIISDSLLKNEIYVIYMGKICNDTIFKKVKVLVDLTYDFDTFRSDILNSKTLKRLVVNGINNNIKFNLKDTNYTIQLLYLFSVKEYFLDSTYLMFKKLNSLGGTFNPFAETNSLIINKLKRYTTLFIDGMDFRNLLITEENYSKLKGRSIIFRNCKFTRQQRKLILKYMYASII